MLEVVCFVGIFVFQDRDCQHFMYIDKSVLRDISAALITTVQLGQLFAKLCDLNANSVYDVGDTTICLQRFLLAFGHVRAKDLSLSLSLSLKYNSNLYKGKHATSLRASLAAHTEKQNGRRIRISRMMPFVTKA